ncbi:cell envelope integrity protein CreD [Flavihumibacter stibioxidans]|uniref:cell envelope integrity protein CreD n=1 Tax=Flavihumibacter stibioxidans TaxID=1834163 RepID=UPI0016508771|nr:cell envelope integrity protein CreD [Flavihumibacter stibioxidans]
MEPVNSRLMAFKIWVFTLLAFGLISTVVAVFMWDWSDMILVIPVTIAAAMGSLPILVLLFFLLPFLSRLSTDYRGKTTRLYGIIFLVITGYGLVAGLVSVPFYDGNWLTEFLGWWAGGTAFLSASAFVGFWSVRKETAIYFEKPVSAIAHSNQSIIIMEQVTNNPHPDPISRTSNAILYKGIITGVLILLMMIPALFINNLVGERKERQQQVVQEVSSKWGSGQTLSGFFLVLPYEVIHTDAAGKQTTERKELTILPETQQVNSIMFPEVRPRSIYKVLLYKTTVNYDGRFVIRLPREIDPASVKWQESRICAGLTDIKGIEEKIMVNLDGSSIELSPGLPNKVITDNGLSAPLELLPEKLNQSIAFRSQIKLKGSEKLHFIPLAGNSLFSIRSSWQNPSFDGNYLPGERVVNDSGFTASWSFNKANLPFGTLLLDKGFEEKGFAFGVTMLQPADQYSKTERSTKYAILFIGLTFSLFFIIELMQKNPVHPVQYVLIGIALSVFYTLLLSFSEFIAFDYAYGLAATATITLITLYAKGHFGLWKTALIFGAVLSCLYAFTFVLVRLEDTALLIGSIGLFLVLALVMYGSRKVQWYGKPVPAA